MQPMRIGIHSRKLATDTAIAAFRVVSEAIMHRIEVVLDREMADQLASFGHPVDPEVERMDARSLPKLDLLLSLGGDGTFLDSVAMTGRSGIPILGINLGRLGFLSNIRIEGSERAMEALANGRFTLEERGLLELSGCEGFEQHPYALNEMSLHKRDSSSMIAVHAYLGDRFLNTYWADGLIVATPTGSTAYSLSCGGPLLAPDCDAMVITPISPHNLNVRPFVVPGNSVIRLIVEARGDKYLVNLDSRSRTMDRARELTLRRADHPAKLVHLEGKEFMNTLREKLNWGLDVRSLGPPGTVFNEE
jgi:NAD+ kinase